MPLPWLEKELLRPGSYPERPANVTVRQTHISYLFFTPGYVYKVKKPVDFGFLDFTTLDKRLYYCREEVRLNRRLARGVYLGVSAIVRRTGGVRVELSERTDKEVLEYAVRMKRLPEEFVLDLMIDKGTVDADAVKRVAAAVAAFHAKAETGPHIVAFGSTALITENTEENFAQTSTYVAKTVTPRQYADIKDYTENFLAASRELFMRRVKGGFIRECHGDIHTEHVYISNKIDILDCIEFNERFRYGDTIADVAFLSMDLDYKNRHDLSLVFEASYINGSGDKAGTELLDFYKCYRAYVRGKVEGFKLKEPETSGRDRALALVKSKTHFRLAHLYATGGYRPTLVVIRGLPAAGKTTLARVLKREAGFEVFSSDMVRKELFTGANHQRRCEGFGEGIYSAEATAATYSTLIERAGKLLSSGRSVILDATFSRARHIRDARAGAEAAGALFCVVECVLDQDLTRRRIEQRAGAGRDDEFSDATWEVYLKQKEFFEPYGPPHLTVDTDAESEIVASLVLDELSEVV